MHRLLLLLLRIPVSLYVQLFVLFHEGLTQLQASIQRLLETKSILSA